MTCVIIAQACERLRSIGEACFQVLQEIVSVGWNTHFCQEVGMGFVLAFFRGSDGLWGGGRHRFASRTCRKIFSTVNSGIHADSPQESHGRACGFVPSSARFLP